MRFCIARVSGDSMLPHYSPGDFVVAWRWPGHKTRIGDVVLFNHAAYGLIVKRIEVIENDRALLAGDSPDSTSRESIGWVQAQAVVPVRWHIRRRLIV